MLPFQFQDLPNFHSKDGPSIEWIYGLLELAAHAYFQSCLETTVVINVARFFLKFLLNPNGKSGINTIIATEVIFKC